MKDFIKKFQQRNLMTMRKTMIMMLRWPFFSRVIFQSFYVGFYTHIRTYTHKLWWMIFSSMLKSHFWELLFFFFNQKIIIFSTSVRRIVFIQQNIRRIPVMSQTKRLLTQKLWFFCFYFSYKWDEGDDNFNTEICMEKHVIQLID